MKPEELLEKAEKIYGHPSDWTQILSELMPDMLESWLDIRQHVADDGVLSRKIKEFILIGINLVRRYPSGVENHMRKALEHGATKEEIMEVIATAVISSSAPAIINGPRVLKKLLEEEQH